MRANLQSEYGWLASQVKPFVRLHVAGYLCIIAASILVLLDPLIVRLLIDDVIPNRRLTWLPFIALAFFVTYMGRLGFDSLAALLNFRAVQKMTFRCRLKLFRHLQQLSAEYHDNQPVGDTLHRLQVDVDQVGTLSGEVIPGALRIVTIFGLVMATMLALNYRLTIIVVPLIPVFVFVRRYFHQYLCKASDQVQAQSAKLIGFLEEQLSAITQVQLLCCEQREARRFARVSGDAVRAQMRRRRTELRFGALLYMIIVLGMSAVLSYGGYQVIKGSMTAGGLIAFYSYTLQLFMPLYGVVDVYSKLQRSAASARRLMEISNADLVIRDHADALTLSSDSALGIELRDVSFAYNLERPVLNKMDLRVNPGERVAIAGASGNGKSTIGKLLPRLYDVREGTILIAGTELKDIKLKSLRQSLILVPQDPVLFDLTLRENLLYGSLDADEEDIWRVTKLAQLESLIQRLPRGWDEPLGPRGNRLSGGERQRVALARALLKRPKILILDECTSALDERTERMLLHNLDGFLSNVTTLIISHRPLSTSWANRVVHMDYGRTQETNLEVLATSAWDSEQQALL